MIREKVPLSRWIWLSGFCSVLLMAGTAAAQSSSPYPVNIPYIGEIVLDDGSIISDSMGTISGIQNEISQYKSTECEGSCTSGKEAGDPDAINFDEVTAPDASQSTAPPTVQVGSGALAPANTPLVRTFHKDEQFGNSKFGAGYVIDASLNATPSSSTTLPTLNAKADGRINATAFGLKKDVARATASAKTQSNGLIVGDAKLYLVGQEVWSKNYFAAVTLDERPLFNRQFFQASTNISIYGYTISVKATVNGTAGTKLSGRLSPNGIEVVYTPEGRSFATASASVGGSIIIASLKVGVQGELTLIDVKLPQSLALVATSCSEIRHVFNSDLIINTLSGKIKVFIKVRIFFTKKKKSKTISSWKGNTRTIRLYSRMGSHVFSFICPQPGIPPIPMPPDPGSPPPPSGDCFEYCESGQCQIICIDDIIIDIPHSGGS